VVSVQVGEAGPASTLDHGLTDLRRLALDVADAGLRAADPSAAVARLVSREGEALRVGDRTYDLAAFRSVVVLGAGKASMAIATALEAVLDDRITGGLVVRRAGDPGTLRRIEVMDSDHPLPSAASLEAGRRLREIALGCGSGDLVVTAFTGGSSALACLPPDGVSFAAKREVHGLLLDSGATIEEINAVRKHLSAIKGGRLAATMPGATLVNLTVSDVVGDALDLLCDTVVQDTSTPADARKVLVRHDLWDLVAPEVRDHLGSPAAASPHLAGRDIASHVLVAGASVLTAMADRVRELGRTPVVLGASLEGEAVSLGGFLGTLARESAVHGTPFAPGSVLVAAGGEATVSIQRRPHAETGAGGPNQEVALGFALAIGSTGRVAGVFLDSDGFDGGTYAAGGCVDSHTAPCADELGIDLDAALARHDARSALERLGDLVVTGPTGTNISDLVVVVLDDLPAPGSSQDSVQDSVQDSSKEPK
jgi:glycerate 2-kinase